MDRPLVTRNQAIELTEEIFGLKVDISSSKNAKELDSYDDRNFYLRGVKEGKEGEFLLKVYNSGDFEGRELVDGIHQVMFCLKESGVDCPLPQNTLSGDLLEIRKFPLTQRTDEAKKPKLDGTLFPCVVCLFSFVPGTTMKEWLAKGFTFNADSFYMVGQFVAIVCNALKNLRSPVLEKREFGWDLYYFNKLVAQRRPKSFTAEQKELVKSVQDSFEKYVKPRLGVLRKQCIHGDLNEGNLIAKKFLDTDSFTVTGAIDFGDVNYSCRVFEIAIAAAYMMSYNDLPTDVDEIINAGASTVAGFNDNCPLSQVESDVLFCCIQARLCQTGCFSTQSSEVYPCNAEYLLYNVRKCWKVLKMLKEVSRDEFDKKWRGFSKKRPATT